VERFRVGVTHDVRGPDDAPVYDLELLERDLLVRWEYLPAGSNELAPEHVAGYDALVVWGSTITAATFEGVDRLSLVARLGVGYDRIDVDACTASGVLLTLAPDGVRRPVAAGAMAFLLALAHRVPEKDRHVRAGRWERLAHPGLGLRGRTLGIVGLGNVGREVCRLAAPFGLRLIASDPYVDRAEGADLVDLETLLREADFVCLTCPLTGETRGLLGAERLALMKPAAFLINVARGPVVDQRALTEALRERRIAGAALDVFEREPIDPDDPLLSLENVILAPHAIALTDEALRETGRSACRAVLAVSRGEIPPHVVNPEALAHPRLAERLRTYAH